jgi:predicted HD superfamily hydrolase involved in NAD metabolism
MYNLEDIIKKLRTLIDERRLSHSIGVSQCAVKLAKHYGADVEKAEVAGLVHDCAKCLPYEESIRLCGIYGFEPDSISKANKALLHAPLGAFLAEDRFQIQDREILSAVACHTTGKKDMTLLEKIICLADYIEDSRRYSGVEDIRAIAYVDINKALLTALEMSIRVVLDRGKLLHPMTVEARNSLLKEIEDSDKSHTKVSLKHIQE